MAGVCDGAHFVSDEDRALLVELLTGERSFPSSSIQIIQRKSEHSPQISEVFRPLMGSVEPRYDLQDDQNREAGHLHLDWMTGDWNAFGVSKREIEAGEAHLDPVFE